MQAVHLKENVDCAPFEADKTQENGTEKQLAVRSSTPPRKRARSEQAKTNEAAHLTHVDCESEESDTCLAKRKNIRRKSKKANLRELTSSSDDQSDDDVIRPIGARNVSVMKAISADSPDLEMIVDDAAASSTPPSSSAQKTKATPPTKGKVKSSACNDDRSVASKARGERSTFKSNGEADRHAEFVRKVGLLRKNGDSKVDSEAGEAHSRGERLEPSALIVPKGAKLTPFEEQVVAIKRCNPATVLLDHLTLSTSVEYTYP